MAVPPLGTGHAQLSHILVEFWCSQRHGRASTSTGRACLSAVLWFWVLMGWHGHAATGMGRASLTGQGGQNFLLFSHHNWTKTYKTNKNNTKQTKIKRLKPWVASHEALV